MRPSPGRWRQSASILGTTTFSRDIAERLARIGLDAESKRVDPESSRRIRLWQRRYDEIIDRMSNVDLDDADADSHGYLAFALQAIGRDSEAIPIL